MIDAHCHLLHRVDDGSGAIEESIAMLHEAACQGIEAIILTPHYRYGMFSYPKEAIEAHFMKLLPYADELGIRLCLGTEYHVDSGMIDAFSSGKCHTLADTRYILTEYSYDSGFSYAKQMTQEALHAGFLPVIAHAERYKFVMDEPGCVDALREMGALVQVNADAILGLDGRGAKKLCREMLRGELVDLVASDSHGICERACHMRQCFEYVEKKYGPQRAERLFYSGPAQILAQAPCFTQYVWETGAGDVQFPQNISAQTLRYSGNADTQAV
jgi:protein-tyrosine phosphatase